jgi:hypothetical protein
VIATLAATLATPYGTRLIRFLLRTATVPRPEIVEWQPLNVVSTLGVVYVVMVLAALAGFYFSTKRRSPILGFLCTVLALLALSSVRHLPLFSLTIVVFSGEHIGSAWQRLLAQRHGVESPKRKTPLAKAFPGILLLSAVALSLASIPHWGCIELDPLEYPYHAVSMLKSVQNSGNMAVPFNWGEYTLWHLGPSTKVSVDGRRETVYTEDVYRQNLAFTYGTDEWDAVLSKYPTQQALVHTGGPAHNLLSLRPGWLVVYEDDVSSLAVREESPLIRQFLSFQHPAEPADDHMCFP